MKLQKKTLKSSQNFLQFYAFAAPKLKHLEAKITKNKTKEATIEIAYSDMNND